MVIIKTNFITSKLCIDDYGVNIYLMLCVIYYHLYSFKNAKNTHGGVLLLVKLESKPATLLKVTLFHGCFCANDTKSRKATHLLQTRCLIFVVKYHVLIETIMPNYFDLQFCVSTSLVAN